MSFRRPKKNVIEARHWRNFLNENCAQLIATGLPEYIYNTQEYFDDFMMHGYLDHPHSPYNYFAADDMNKEQVDALREIMVRYLVAGFGEPGLVPLSNQECKAIRAEAERRLKKTR